MAESGEQTKTADISRRRTERLVFQLKVPAAAHVGDPGSAAVLAAQLAGQRLLGSVFLVKALGGDWERPVRLAGG